MYWHVGRERHLSIEVHTNTPDAIKAAIRRNLTAKHLGEPEDFTVQASKCSEPVVMEVTPHE